MIQTKIFSGGREFVETKINEWIRKHRESKIKVKDIKISSDNYILHSVIIYEDKDLF